MKDTSHKRCEHSDKECTCGGHNHKNAKKNKKHNSTKKKLGIKLLRRWLRNAGIV